MNGLKFQTAKFDARMLHHPYFLFGAGYAAFQFTSCADRGRAERRVALDPRTPGASRHRGLLIRPLRLAKDGDLKRDSAVCRRPARDVVSGCAEPPAGTGFLPAAGAPTPSGRDWRNR